VNRGSRCILRLLSPIVGWFGTAVTGSDTSSNSLFRALQVAAAHQSHLSPTLLAAANSSGGVMRPRDDVCPQPAIVRVRFNQERSMSMAESVYRVTELVGVSSESWEAAARNAVETAAKTLRNLRVAEAHRFDVTIEDGKVTSYRVRVDVSFKYESDE
jgi:dodecin